MDNDFREGYIQDYISGAPIKATPEEIDAVQVFSKQLVEDYGYGKKLIQTRPQYRVKRSPSDISRTLPVDIMIFRSAQRTEEDEYIIVECKKKTRKDGISQLKDYLSFSKAELGVWFNGHERLFLRKAVEKGKLAFFEIPNIPVYGQRVEDIGNFKRRDLKSTHNLKTVFNTIRNYLAGNNVGTTRDEIIAQQLINLVFCKIYDERFTRMDDIITFRAGFLESAKTIQQRIEELFKRVKAKYKEVIQVADHITLDPESIKYVVGELQGFCITESDRDVVADAFETFIGYSLKGAQGQFFTPRNVVKLLVEIVDPNPDEVLIDPACGSGGFLVEGLRHIWKKLDKRSGEYGWTDLALNEERMAVAMHNIRGIEKDDFLSKVAKAYMAIIGDGKGGIYCEDSLKAPKEWDQATRQKIDLDKFDIVLTNPPFGKEIKVKGTEKLKQFDLAYHWNLEESGYERSDKLKSEETIQILFIERALKLLRKGGRLGIVLPETFFHAPKTRYVLQYMLRGNNVTWMIDLPHNTFRPHNNAKCLIIVLVKGQKQGKIIKMAVAEEMGHDHQGKEIYRWDFIDQKVDYNSPWDDIELILKELKSKTAGKYTFSVESRLAINRSILVPRYYWRSKVREIESAAKKDGMRLVPVQELIRQGILSYFDGHGSPPAEYKGRGEIPYVRVKDIVNWEVYKDPTSKITREIYLEKKGIGKDIAREDVVYVRRGSYRIGSVAMVSPYDTEALFTRELLILRVKNRDNEYDIDPYYLLYLFSHRYTHILAKNKILIETTLPNIANRWQEIMLPVFVSGRERKRIAQKVKEVIHNKWKAIEQIEKLRSELGDIVT